MKAENNIGLISVDITECALISGGTDDTGNIVEFIGFLLGAASKLTWKFIKAANETIWQYGLYGDPTGRK